MISYLTTLVCALVLIYMGLIYENTSLMLLGFSAVSLSLLSFIMLLFVSRKASVRLSIPLKVTEKGQEITLRAEFKNGARIPWGKCRITVLYGESHQKERKMMKITIRDVDPGERVELRRLSILASGDYEFSIKKIRVFEPLGIYSHAIRGKSIAKALVLPKHEEVTVKLGEGVKRFYGETMDYDEDQPGQDVSETFGVREFHDGDKLQRIHWKLSARMDELMVKEDSLPKACAILLFMPDHFKENDALLDYMASLSFSLMDAKCAHYIVFVSADTGDITRIRVDDEESFYLAMTSWLTDGSRKPEEGKVSRYRDKYRGEHFLHSIVAMPGGKVSIDESEPLSPKEYREELYLR